MTCIEKLNVPSGRERESERETERARERAIAQERMGQRERKRWASITLRDSHPISRPTQIYVKHVSKHI